MSKETGPPNEESIDTSKKLTDKQVQDFLDAVFGTKNDFMEEMADSNERENNKFLSDLFALNERWEQAIKKLYSVWGKK